MEDELFSSIIKYLKDRIKPKNKKTKKEQAQWEKLADKYKLENRSLVLKDQPYRRIISRSGYYPLMYTFHNDLMAGHLGYKKVIKKLSERYY